MHVVELLNKGILGGNAGAFRERSFNVVGMDHLTSPDYSPKYFETFPTMWASASAFERSLRQSDPVAVREWACLFLLHYFRVAHFDWADRQAIEYSFGHNLSSALAGSYPPKALMRVGVLRLSDGTIVGAFYPSMLFFPSRGRGTWAKSALLAPLLAPDSHLDWDRCEAQFLTDSVARNGFYAHMRSLAVALGGLAKDVLDGFRRAAFPGMADGTGTLRQLDASDPTTWLDKLPTPGDLLGHYPLKRARQTGGTTYYLVSDMQQLAGWMTAPIVAGLPSPAQYVRAPGNEHAIYVGFGGQQIRCALGERDEVVPLSELLLSDDPYFCAVKTGSDAHASKVKALHRIGNRDSGGIFSDLGRDEIGILLAPVRTRFLEHFPEVLRDGTKGVVPSIDRVGDSISWTFTILGKEVRVSTVPIRSYKLPDMKLALWPPKVCDLWHLYVARGTGVDKQKCGRLALVDEQGRMGKVVELEDEVYVSVLNDPAGSNRPRALTLLDPADRERGVLFLSDLPEQTMDTRTHVGLAVDFGTSNTCLARQVEGTKPEPLVFDLSPDMLWGEKPALETPGFVPFEWAGMKGYFPTILLSRRSAKSEFHKLKLEQLRPDHLFKVDVLGLHHDIVGGLYAGKFEPLWNVHSNLKWKWDDPDPWRAIFLATTLLYAHAQICFGDGAMVHDYVFTFPLAFGQSERKIFHEDAELTIKKVRTFCYGTGAEAETFRYNSQVDESTAIAASAMAVATSAVVEVFLDVGGGTTDLAIRHDSHFLALDSVRVAGNAFFQFAETNFDAGVEPHGSHYFKKHLAFLLLRDDTPEFPEAVLRNSRLNLATFYSLAINGLDDREFHKKEGAIIEQGMGRPSYQHYRSVLFFRHLLAYGILQGCAAVVNDRLRPTNGLSLILGGNGWGLLLFRELQRSKTALLKEAREILSLLKTLLADSLTDEERPYLEALTISDVNLLNEHNLSQSKTAVAKGALLALKRGGATDRQLSTSTAPFAGVTIERLRINENRPVTVRWCDRWGFDELSEKVGERFDEMKHLSIAVPEDLSYPLDPVLSLFTRLGNQENRGEDLLPEQDWVRLNGLLSEGHQFLDEKRRPRYSPINYFIARLLYPNDEDQYFLDQLARLNGTFQ